MNTNLEEQEDELLALQSIFDSEEFVRDESKFSGEFRVSVELPSEFIVALKEGESQRQYDISFLPPLLLTFDLPEDYPSSSPPSFSLTCSWLTHTQIAALSAQLVELYQATGGAVVLFSWVQFVREDALKFLDIHSVLELPSDGGISLQDKQNAAASGEENDPQNDVLNGGEVSASDPVDPGAQGAASVQDSPEDSPDYSPEDSPEDSPQDGDQSLCDVSPTPSQALLSQILIHDAAQKQRVFDSTVFDCGVCFVGWLGSHCVQLPECGHIFCRACLGEFCRLQIKEGTVRSVTCPQAGCTATPTPAQVRRLVGEELFSRYDRLLLQSTLDGMSDVVYCPRPSCAAAVIQSSSAALCSACGFAFCVKCRKTYHGTDNCRQLKKISEEMALTLDLPRSGDGRIALQQDYLTGSKERKRLLESRYGKDILTYVIDYGLSEDWITENSKPCPHCFRRIEKNGGCNSMWCSQCKQGFCWACLARFTPMEPSSKHFQNGSCSAYPS